MRWAALLVMVSGCHDLDRLRRLARQDAAADVAAPADATPDHAADAPPDRPDRPPDQAPLPPPSCRSLSATCGPQRESCCASSAVPRHPSYIRGYDLSNTPSQGGVKVVGFQPQTSPRVSLDAFSLDTFEVTVGRFRSFLDVYDDELRRAPLDMAGAHPNIPGSGWHKDWTNANGTGAGILFANSEADLRRAINVCSKDTTSWLGDATRANDVRPMTCVSWYEAFMFCIWDDGGRLPTEAEWNLAAAGAEMYRPFPWSTDPRNPTIGPDDANIMQPGAMLRNVGSLPLGVGRFGQYDLAGNAYEFTRDRTPEATPDNYRQTGSNPLDHDGNNLIVRGGSFRTPEAFARTAYRRIVGDSGSSRFDDLGWRCAR